MQAICILQILIQRAGWRSRIMTCVRTGGKENLGLIELKLEMIHGTEKDVITKWSVFILRWLHKCSQLQACRLSQTLLSRKVQSHLQKLFLSSIDKKGMSKIWTANTGTISPYNQKILSGVKYFSEFTFSFIEVPSQAALDRCNSVNGSQRLVSMPCVEAACRYLDGWRPLVFCGFVKAITVLPVFGVSWGLQDFFIFCLYPQSSGQQMHYKEQKALELCWLLRPCFFHWSQACQYLTLLEEREKWMIVSGS